MSTDFVQTPLTPEELGKLKASGLTPYGSLTDTLLLTEKNYLVLAADKGYYKSSPAQGTHNVTLDTFILLHGRGSDLSQPGAKADAGKPDPTLILDSMPRALMALAEVGTFGANKYSRDGWLSVPQGEQRYSAAQDRHRFLRCQGEAVDSESGLDHEYHEVWNALAKLELKLRRLEKENV